MASDLNLDAIEKRANAATKPPWTVVGRWHSGKNIARIRSWYVPVAVECGVDGYWVDGEDVRAPDNQACDNAEFIAHARQDIPALVKRVRELERIVEESIVSGSELVVGQYVLIREKLAYDEYGYTATAINGTHRPTSLEPKLDLWEAAEQARRWSMVPPPDIHAAKGLAAAIDAAKTTRGT